MTTSNILEIGKRIRALRENLGLTQLDLAKELNVKRQTVAQWENGERDLKTGYIIALAKFFNVTSDYLLGLSDYKTETKADIGMITGLSDKNIDFLTSIQDKEHKSNEAIYHYSLMIINEIIELLSEPNIGYANFYGMKGYNTELYCVADALIHTDIYIKQVNDRSDTIEKEPIRPKELVEFISKKEYLTSRLMRASEVLYSILDDIIRIGEIENAYNEFFVYLNEIMDTVNYE